ncbi:MAG: YkgJ family cysteine cluster protein [Candidatus Bathyarchaeia archaeon]
MSKDEIETAVSYPSGLRFECQRCSRCCTDTEARERRIVLLRAEVELIARAKGITPETFAFPNAAVGLPYRFSMKKMGGKCIFLRGTECAVYEARPLVCRFYPFELKRSRRGGYEFTVTREDCPGLGQGRPLPARFFKELFAYAEHLFQAS